MDRHALGHRLWNKWRRFSIRHGARRKFTLDADVPYVSFTFDDFPRSAFVEGGRILSEHGARGTYFVSCDLLGRPSVSGTIASGEDVQALLREGHELGCHTFEHLDGTQSSPAAFERSIEINRAAVNERAPGVDLNVFAYPLDGPVLSIKKSVGRHFVACRGGGQTFNAGVIDLNLLKAYFLDKRDSRNTLAAVAKVIEQNAAARGWLIFATHDVTVDSSRYGCEPEYFDHVVRLARESGARVLPMTSTCRELRITSPSAAGDELA
jgi:peptidoglycan/xylan/chitin deacetylase (PgdA/CDA1 family)